MVYVHLRDNAPRRAHHHSHAVHNNEIVVVFLLNDLLALMLNQLMRSWGGIRRFAEGSPQPMLFGRIDLDPPSERVEL